MSDKKRCVWAGESEIYIDYHDNEWGRVVHDDRKFFEMMILESFQAGLSWITILKKREDFRVAFDNFDPEVVALYDDKKVAELLANEKIVRNRGKILSAINNAKLFLDIVREHGSFDKFIWSYVNFSPILGDYDKDTLPAKTELSDKISADFKKRGFKFFGSTIVYSFLQATGLVNDHTKDCILYKGK